MPGALTSHRNRGAGLIEVLLALLLVAIATLGLAALQLSARQLGHQASQRSQAVALAADLLERMRANPSVLPRYAVAATGAASGIELAEPALDCRLAHCEPVPMSTWDLWQWTGALDGLATGGAGNGLFRAIGRVAVAGGRVEVAISWQGKLDLDGRRRSLQLVSFVGGEVR